MLQTAVCIIIAIIHYVSSLFACFHNISDLYLPIKYSGSKDIHIHKTNLWAVHWWIDVYIRHSIYKIIVRPVVYRGIHLGSLPFGMQVCTQHTP